MNKKIVISIIVVIVIAIVSFGIYFLLNNNDNSKQPEQNPSKDPVMNDEQPTPNEPTPNPDKKILVVYYSATGSTKKVAEQISKNLNADLFEIIPEDIYTSDDLDWTDSNSRVTREHENESLRNTKLKNTKVDNWESYDTVLIGYPIWWGIAAWPVNYFIKDNDFNGKTVIPFCTSSSSGLGQSGELLKEEAKDGNWMNGQRFSSSASSSDIKVWTDSLK